MATDVGGVPNDPQVPAIKVYYAHVKYSTAYGENITENVLASKISIPYINSDGKPKRKKFLPKSVTDYDPRLWYKVNSSQGVPEGREKPFRCLIGRLAGTLSGTEEVTFHFYISFC